MQLTCWFLQLLLAVAVLCQEEETDISHYMNTNGTVEYHMYEMELNQKGTLKSPSFPLCCEDAYYTIKCLTESCYIRLIFTDLDLAGGSSLHIYDGDSESASLFEEQPELKRGIWYRPTISSSGTSLHLKFQPNKLRSSRHLGFKAKFWTVNNGCGLLKSAVVGNQINLELPSDLSLGIHTHSVMTQDCVWVLKVPELPDSSELFTYARFTMLEVQGVLEVHEGLTSEGKMLAGSADQLETYTLDTDPVTNQRTMGFHSTKGLYIRMQAENDKDNPQDLSFVYGIFRKEKKSAKTCEFNEGSEGLLCKQGKKVWCFPLEYTCNDVENCPDGSDEGDICLPPTTTTVTSTSTMTPPTTPEAIMYWGCPDHCQSCYEISKKCTSCEFLYEQGSDGECSVCSVPSLYKMCENGECVSTYSSCPEECGYSTPFKCDNGDCKPASYQCDNYDDCGDNSDERDCDACNIYSEKKCSDGSCVGSYERCPGDSCPYDRPYRCDSGSTCIPNSYKCDSGCDCSDCSDENDCSSTSFSSSGWYAFLIVIALAITCCAIGVKYCKRQRSASRGGQTVTHTTPVYTGTQMVPVAPTATAGYTPVPPAASNPPAPPVGYTHVPPAASYPPVPPVGYGPVPPNQTFNGTSGYTPTPASAPPPSYYQVPGQETRPLAGSTEDLPPPPSYDSVAASAPNEYDLR